MGLVLPYGINNHVRKEVIVSFENFKGDLTDLAGILVRRNDHFGQSYIVISLDPSRCDRTLREFDMLYTADRMTPIGVVYPQETALRVH